MKAIEYGSPAEQRRFKLGWISGRRADPRAHKKGCRDCAFSDETLHCRPMGEKSTYHCLLGDFSTTAIANCIRFQPKGSKVILPPVTVTVKDSFGGYVTSRHKLPGLSRAVYGASTCSMDAAVESLAGKLFAEYSINQVSERTFEIHRGRKS
jgi:hypothetical protein